MEASVAGESPDRSKQQSSSGTPAPDPRMGLAREAEPARVDHATAVFGTKVVPTGSAGETRDGGESVAPVPEPPADDQRLRKAVAAWVTTAGDAPKEPSTADVPGSRPESGVPGPEKEPETGETPSADASDEVRDASGELREEASDGDGSGAAGAVRDVVPAADDGDATDTGAPADAVPQREDAPGGDAVADGDGSRGAVAATATDVADTGAPADAVRDAVPQGDGSGGAVAETAADVADAGAPADAVRDAVPEGDGSGGAVAETAADVADAGAPADAVRDEVPERAGFGGAAAGGGEAIDAGAPADAVRDRIDVPGAVRDVVADGDGSGGAVAETAADVADTGAPADAVRDAVPEGDGSGGAVAEAAADAGAAAGAVRDEVPQGDGSGGAAAGAGGEATDGGAPADSVRDRIDAPGAVRDAVAKADSRVTDDRDPVDAKAGSPVDAVTDEVPQGHDDGSDVPAGDAVAESVDRERTDGEDSGPVDQATAVFKAPVIPPGVDQATTTLKVDDLRKRESDAERTSKFVALKPLPETVGERPAPAWAAKPPAAPPGPPAPPEARAPVAQPTAPPEPPEAHPLPRVERTTQQPLPPKPPLDLLAELTNTPPPRQTPLRTTMRRVKIWTPLAILVFVAFAVAQALRPLPVPTLSLTADPSYSFDGTKVSLPWPQEGQGWMDASGVGTMDHFGEQKPVPIGSVAKAMTAYVILKEHPLEPGADGPAIPVDARAEKEGGYDETGGESTLNTVKENDQLSQKDALAAVMIPSANNIARLLARWDAGSEAAFVQKMNDAAKELGMDNTTYTDPSGLKETTVSSAEDQVKLGNQLVRIQALTDITKLPSWKDPSGKVWSNYNRLVPYDNAIGIKTGSTTKAGGNLLFAANKQAGGETVTVVGAVLGQHKPPIIDTVNAVSKTAMLAAQDAVKASTILKKGDVVGQVDDGLGGLTPVVATKDVSAVGWAGLTVKLKLTDAGDALPHTATAGTKVGVLTVGDGSGGAVEVPVALQKDLAEPGFGAKLTRVG
ncbi:D-alanyl-D-alanine carboxypeptidase [Streptomyces sp. NPDC058001]|uniref:D-alanyl-D-alanine carboxypeptidase n=1 Tax=Streptomyces sp. NPDC058001 TaxID=3346300 RepID=UPI0036EBB51E